ncbi:MAG: hypothetical protein J5I93_23155 [Pirellulaceae bacterium]|nr:hypothetical protein [Pirellulaceae bacterium]
MTAAWLICLLLGGEMPADVAGPARASEPTGPDVAVVCPAQWVQVLQPWLAHRQAQGHRVQLVSNAGSVEEIHTRLRTLHALGSLRYVLLVGDAEPAARLDPAIRARTVPAGMVRARVNVHWGSEPEIASDNPYADLDGDHVPDVALGRLPVDTADELAALVRRILHYETQAAAGHWQRRVNFVAGVGGFGKLADSVLEMATKKFLTEGIPPAYTMSMTYGSWRSPFCPDPRRFHQATLDRLNEGCLFWVYIGHGQRRYLDRVQVPGGAFHILDTDDTARLQVAEGAPIAIFLACYTGAYDDPRDCLAEEMLRSPQGPVAVLGGSRVTMPYAMAVMGNALMDEYFRERRATLGEIVWHAKRRLVQNPEGSLDDVPRDSVAANRLLLDALARTLSPSAELLEDERREHLALFNLLGDPLLRLPQPDTVRLELADEALAGQRLELTGHAPLAGHGILELVCRHDCLRGNPPPRASFEPSHEALVQYDQVYREANNRQWTAVPVRLDQGTFRLQLDVPEEVRGPCFVRVALQGDRKLALGAAKVFVRGTAAAQ